ncbi:SDR family oxidoreductase, partial [Rhodococcus sp. NCIMB 12038]
TSGIRINAVAPGPIATAMTAAVPTDIMDSIVGRTAAGRYGQPDEVGQAVAWLCSDQASYINGAVLPVDGGWLAS